MKPKPTTTMKVTYFQVLFNEEMQEPGDSSEVYLPSKPMEKDHVLMPDLSTYDMLHSMSVQWPFLSFDVIKDELGDERRNVPKFSCEF